MSEDDDKILELPLDFSRRTYRWRVQSEECLHTALRIDRATRTVLCRGCQAPLDPLDVLDAMVTERRNAEHLEKDLRQEELQRRERLEQLRREEAKARKRVREAKAEDPVEAYKAQVLDHVARWIDRIMDFATSRPPRPGDEETVTVAGMQMVSEPGKVDEWRAQRATENLSGLYEVCHALFGGESPDFEKLRRKIGAAEDELAARRKRQKIQILPRKKA